MSDRVSEDELDAMAAWGSCPPDADDVFARDAMRMIVEEIREHRAECWKPDYAIVTYAALGEGEPQKHCITIDNVKNGEACARSGIASSAYHSASVYSVKHEQSWVAKTVIEPVRKK